MSENQEKDSNLQQTIEAQQPVEEGEAEQTSADAIKEDIQSNNQETPQQPVEEGEGEQTSADAIKEDIQNKNQETPQQPAEESEQASSIEKKLIEEIKTRLIDRNWDEKITSEFDKLGDDKKKDLLVEALKQIYNSNDKNGNNLQQELGLDNNSFTSLIIATVNNNFDSYKELFAEKQPKQMTINLADITENIKNTFIFEQSKAKQAQQQDQEQDQEQDQQQTKELTEFDKKVQQRMNDAANLVEQGKAKEFKDIYKQNLEDPVEHEIDIVALHKLKNNEKQKKIYRKVNPLLFIHGTYAKMKFDQLDYDNRYKAVGKVLENESLKNIEKLGKVMQKYPNDLELTKEGIGLCCNQDDKLQKRTLNAILPATKNVVIEDVDVLKKAFEDIPQQDNGYSITKPMKDDMAYFKILYARANEETRNNLLDSEEFKTKFDTFSPNKQKKFIHFLEDIGEKEKIVGLKSQQNEESKGQISSDDTIVDAMIEDENEKFGVKITKDSNSKENLEEEQSAPFYVFGQNGISIKNDENLLAKETFKLQDSFLGLACAKDKKAFVLSDWMRAKQTRDKDGEKIKDKDKQITSNQVKAQRAAEKAAREAIKEAGGDFNAIKKKTMPLLKNTEITFTFRGKPIPLSQAVRVCIKLEQRRREREQNLAMLKGEKIPEKTSMERISEMLKLNVENGHFSDKEMKSIQEAISAQIIATQAFVKTFNEKNTALANKPEDKKEQVVQKQQETTTTQEQDQIEQQSANNVPGSLRSFGNGQSQETPQQERVTMNMIAKRLEKQIEQQQEQTKTQNQNDTRPATPVSGQESEQSKPNGTPVPQEVPARTSVEQQTQKEDKNQSKDTSLNGPERDSHNSSLINNEDTRQQIKEKIFHEGGLDSEIQRQKAAEAQLTDQKDFNRSAYEVTIL